MKPGLGSIDNPLKLQDALGYYKIKPGEVVYIRGGTYAGEFTCKLAGTKDEPITIRPYKSEHVTIDGGLVDNGAHTIWQDIEFMYSRWTTRRTEIEGSFPADMPIENEIAFKAPGTIVQRCTFHDLCSSVGFWAGATGGIFRYNVVYHNGWSAPDRGHSHGLYSQNTDKDNPKQVYGNIWYGGFCVGLKAYSSEEGYVDGYNIHDNISFWAGALYDDLGEVDGWPYYVGSWYETCDYIRLERNYSYQPEGLPPGQISRVGYITHVNEYNNQIYLIENYWPEGRLITNCNLETDTGFYGPRPKEGQVIAVIPAGDKRANIAAYNWDKKQSVTVDVSKVLSAGSPYRLRNVQDYYGDIIDGMVGQDGTINIDMRTEVRKVGTPVKWTAPPSTFPEFGAFVLEG